MNQTGTLSITSPVWGTSRQLDSGGNFWFDVKLSLNAARKGFSRSAANVISLYPNIPHLVHMWYP